MSAAELCWCCARYGLTVPAVAALNEKSGPLCHQCLGRSPSACKTRHVAEALALAAKP